MPKASRSKNLPQVAIIGAGMAGLSLAHMLEPYTQVTLFEKSGGVGGRMSTRYAGEHQFDHGAQYFTARSKAFKRFLAPLIEAGSVKDWQPHVLTLGGDKKPYKRDWFEPHYVATPKMNQLGKLLAAGKNVLLKTHIAELEKTPQGWLLRDNSGKQHGHFDWLVSTAPAPQTAKLLPTTFSAYAELEEAEMAACYCLMIGLDKPLTTTWQAAVVKDSCIGWIAIDSSKPDRGAGCSLVIHSTPEWAEQHLEDDQLDIQQQLFAALERLLGSSLESVAYSKLHRWRYASTVTAPEDDYLLDEQLKLAVCADWLIDGHVESAFLSALALSKTLLAKLETASVI